MDYNVNVKLRCNRVVVGEEVVSRGRFLEITSPSNNKVIDLDGGYKVQGFITVKGRRITYTASKVFSL